MPSTETGEFLQKVFSTGVTSRLTPSEKLQLERWARGTCLLGYADALRLGEQVGYERFQEFARACFKKPNAIRYRGSPPTWTDTNLIFNPKRTAVITNFIV